MSECVVRMTLPKGCVWRDDKGHIKICPLYWEDEGRCQGKDGKEAPWYDGKRPDWCPILCQLQQGHGRLVDADDAFAQIVKRSIKGYISNTGVYAALQEAPTIVPAERSEKDGR